ncbi:MAG: hypothetical protein NUV69_01295 [Candidatus Curtissbacteria bacterium]|nr:hypothetical protein [Candidatus Curtissbacteria bacterium]
MTQERSGERLQGKGQNGVPGGGLSPELRDILEGQSLEAEVDAAIDAVLEEGYQMAREEMLKVIQEMKKDPSK